MPRKGVLKQLVDQLAAAVAAKLNNARSPGRGNGRRTRGASPLRGQFSAAKMRCRFALANGKRCPHRSLGPKNHWFCAEYLRNPGWSATKKVIEKAARALADG